MDIMRAKELIAGLADGLDPLTGEILPDDSICNRPEIVRALHAVLSELSPKAARQLPVNAGKPWTEVEENRLIEEFDAGMKISEIAKEHGRTRGAIESRLSSLGKIERVPKFPMD